MYEQRILNFLKKYPKLSVDGTDLARIWKRREADVAKSVSSLLRKRLIIRAPMTHCLQLNNKFKFHVN